MENDTVQILLGNGAITVLILAGIQLVQKMRENRTVLRTAYETREQRRYEQDAHWVASYRAAAEAHLEWDQDMRISNVTLQAAVNRLEERAGGPLTKFEPLPKAPPLFPPIEDRPHE